MLEEDLLISILLGHQYDFWKKKKKIKIKILIVKNLKKKNLQKNKRNKVEESQIFQV